MLLRLKNEFKDAWQEKGSLPVLDGFRGIAACLVLLAHIFYAQFADYPLLDSIVFTSGHNGVNLFFVLSGFLISYPFWKSMYYGGSKVNLKIYYLKRALRVLPLFYISTLVFTLTSLLIKGDIIKHLETLPYQVLLVHNFFKEMNFVNTPAWTIAVELHFYLLLSLFFIWCKNDPVSKAISKLMAIWCIIFCYKTWAYFEIAAGGSYQELIYANTVARLDQFILGMLASLFYITAVAGNMKIGYYISKYSWLLVSSGLIIIAFSISIEYIPYLRKLKPGYISISHSAFISSIGFLLIVLASLFDNGKLKTILTLNLLGFLGKISFSLYLIHLPIYKLLYKPFFIEYISSSRKLCSITFLPLILMVSFLSFVFIEKPFLEKKAVLSNK